MKLTKLAVVVLLGVVLVAGLASLIVLSWPGDLPPNRASLYAADREQIEAAVGEYMTSRVNAHPPVSYMIPVVDYSEIYIGGEGINGDKIELEMNYYPIAVCTLLTSSFPKGILKEVPASCAPQNCIYQEANAEPGIIECTNNCSGHYLWLTTETGDIASICIGRGCAAHGEDGYQGVYP